MNDQTDIIISWVEEQKAPAKTLVVDEQGHLGEKITGKGYLLCSYPNFPKYKGGPADQVSSYVSAAK